MEPSSCENWAVAVLRPRAVTLRGNLGRADPCWTLGERWRENLWPWEMCVIFSEKSSLKMGLLIFPEHVGNTDICVGAVVTVKMAFIIFHFYFLYRNSWPI